LKKKITNFALLCFFLLGVISSVKAQTFDSIYAQKLQTALNNLRNNNGIVGMSAAVFVPGQGIWKGTSGISEPGVNITPDMVFGIGSITKNFTATIILQLAEADSLSINDPLYKWLPHYDNVDSNITIKQLLDHTSGIYNYTDNPAFSAALNANLYRVWQPEELMQFVAAPNFPPGTSWRYSNTNYLLLGIIIKKITRTSLSEQYHTRFFTPLGMTETYMETQDTMNIPFAHNWVDLNGDGIKDDASIIPRTAIFSAASAAGELVSRPENLLKWSRNLYKGNILSQSSLNQMLTFVSASIAGGNGYGLGTIRYNIGGKTCYGHGGNIFGYSSAIIYYPQDSICMALTMNIDINTGPVATSFMNTVLTQRPVGITNSITEIPTKYNLEQNYPNPFNPETNIKFDLPSQGEVKLIIYNSLGKEISQLVAGKLAAGSYSYKWNAANFPSGVYFYKLQAENFTSIKKMMLVK
jgi:D-alanyl-D-alanine carboxypeptidase